MSVSIPWLITFFLLGAGVDYASVLWHTEREAGNKAKAAVLSAVLEVLAWTPLVFVIEWQDYSIAAASVVGSVVGCYLGMVRNEKKKIYPVL